MKRFLSFAAFRLGRAVEPRIPRWDTLRAIGNSRIVQLSALVPFIGYILLFGESTAHLFHMVGGHVTTGIGLWDRLLETTVYFLYFGLFAMGIGALAYQMFCPDIVKKYPDAESFILAEKAITAESDLEVMVHYAGMDEFIDDAGIVRTPNDEDGILRVMRGFYRQSAVYSPRRRWITTVFFYIGFLLISVPSVVSAVRIGSDFLSTLIGGSAG